MYPKRINRPRTSRATGARDVLKLVGVIDNLRVALGGDTLTACLGCFAAIG
jgi:hypothetical protein